MLIVPPEGEFDEDLSPAARCRFSNRDRSRAALRWLAPLSAQAQTYEVLKAFPQGPANSDAELLEGDDGNFYGTTYKGGAGDYGTVFKVSKDGATFSTLHSFANSDGANPYAGLVKGDDGNFYGSTVWGGSSGYGTIFKISPDCTAFSTIHSFGNSDGANPSASLMKGDDGNLYGTTSQIGTGSYGTIFKISQDGTTFSTIHSFGNSDGAYPYARLLKGDDGNLYGTTSQGESSDAGNVFKISPDGATFLNLHTFANSDGTSPRAGLVKGDDGNLYGTTVAGGASDYGTIFKISQDGANFSTLHSFALSDGGLPYAGLVKGDDGNLYGTTSQNGSNGYGTIFKISQDGTTFSTLQNFAASPGAYPYAAYPFASLVKGDDREPLRYDRRGNQRRQRLSISQDG